MTYVTVSVPQHLLAEVYALLLNNLDTHDPRRHAEAVPVEDHGDWTQAEVAELSRRLTHPGGRAALDAIASASLEGRGASYEELRAAAAAAMEDGKFSLHQLRAQLAWVSRYAGLIHGTNGPLIHVADLGKAYPAGERYRYTLSRRIAQWWLDLSTGR